MENNADLRGVAGYHHVNNNEARDLIQPYLGQDGYYLLRPSDQDGIVCTICVVNKMKQVNYRVSEDKQTGQYFIHNEQPFPSVQELVHYYALNPINAEAMTLLLNPIMAEENYVVMEKEDVVVQKNGNKPHKGSVSKQQRPVATSGKGTTKGDVDSSLVGLHKHLPNSHLSAVMEPYLGEDGHYLLRLSSTSEGQLVLTVSHLGKHLNFKINYENGQYFINTKKRFDSMKQLLEFYHNAPIKSKHKDVEVYLLFPIPADEELELQFEKEAEAMKVTKSEVVEDPLPEPWQQFYNEEYQRHYYHNPITNSTMWERPRVSSGREKRRCDELPSFQPQQSTEPPNKPDSMYTPDKNVLASMQIYPREKQWATSMEIIQDQMSCCSVDAPIPHPVAPPSAVTITAPTNWRIGKRLGSGACGEVFICHDRDTGRELAVKMVNIEQADQHEVRMELQLLQNLRHERIVTYYGTDIRDEKLCIFMEFMPGGSIHQHMKDTRAALTETLTRKYTRQILEGVAYLHDNKIVHRDIKGANILRNSNDNIKLADFGASKRLQTICSGLKSVQGTPYWMAPEVIKQELYTGKADIWSIGATVVEMLTGDHPWHTLEPFAAMFKIGSEDAHPDLPSHCSKYAEDFLLLCFNRDKSLRSSARELLDTPFVKLT